MQVFQTQIVPSNVTSSLAARDEPRPMSILLIPAQVCQTCLLSVAIYNKADAPAKQLTGLLLTWAL